MGRLNHVNRSRRDDERCGDAEERERTGTLAIAAKRRVVPTAIVHGIDASPAMIARASRKARKAYVDVVLGPSLGTLAGTLEPTPSCASWAHVEGRSRESTRQKPPGHLARLQCVALQLQCILEDPFVDDQITVRLPTPLGRTLRRTSRRLGLRPSQVVRLALEAFLQGAPSADGKRAERVEHLIGSLSSGIPDLAERHREYVLASLKHAR